MSDTTISFEKAAAERTADDGKNDRSTIAFPYLDLDAGIEVSRGIYQRAGLGACEIDELAAQMGQTVSGAFRMKAAAARAFGLAEKDGRGSYKLTELGRQVVSPDGEGEARAAAFLNVALYKQVFEKYRGHLLPPVKALEREMIAMGVAPKQADKARQAFDRSARQAGFFAHGEDRLVQPRFGPPPETRRVDPTESPAPAPTAQLGAGGGGTNDLHPFIQGLLKTLPPPESEWDAAAQAKWLQTAASIFGLIYRSTGTVKVEVQQ